jgi:hypothetical protein
MNLKLNAWQGMNAVSPRKMVAQAWLMAIGHLIQFKFEHVREHVLKKSFLTLTKDSS